MSQYFRYQHLRNLNPGVEPSPDNVREGEIAVNLAKDNEKIFLKNTSDEIVKFITEAQIDAKIQSQAGGSDSKISALSGDVMTLDNKVNNLSSTTISSLNGKVDKSTYNAYVSATAAELESKASSSDVYGKRETYSKSEVDLKVGNDTKDFFDNVKYEESGNTHVISFYNGEEFKDAIDAAPFLVDGMVKSVEVKDVGGVSCLVITFNTDAGIEETVIPLSTIFEPGNYYTKEEVTSLVNVEKNRAQTAEATISTNLSNEITARTKAVSDEKTRAQAAENSLSNAIANESTNRTNAITAERNRAETAENTLSSAINNEKLRAEFAESSLSSAIAAEASTRENAINDEIAYRKAVDGIYSNSYVPNTSAYYINNATSLNDADVKISTALEALSSKTITEVVSTNNSIEATKYVHSDDTMKVDIKTDASSISGLTAVANSDEGRAKISGVSTTDSVKKGIENLYKTITSEIAARKYAIAARTISSRNKGIIVSEFPNSDGFSTSVELTLDGVTTGTGMEQTGSGNSLKITSNGLFLSTDWVCGDFN